MSFWDLLNAPLEDVLKFLEGKPDFIAEAVAKMAINYIKENPQETTFKIEKILNK